ncbi:hypothetical protein ABII15_28295 [Streptomyces sp. HUAS MG91]|uniref:Uncharacterized protein n=1 Tax=Streptomyces tabacisoli TaxID=3156398 RepID=A0AAU8J0M6_9ACTN
MRYPTAQERTTGTIQRVIEVRGGAALYVAGVLPEKDARDGFGPHFTVSADPTGHQPVCSVSRRAPGSTPGTDLAVTAPDGAELGVLRPPLRGAGGRPRYEMSFPDGTTLTGRRGTVSAWILYVVLSPLLLIYNIAGLVGGYGRPDWHLPSRTAWRPGGGPGLGLAPVKFSGMTDKYKVRTDRLDMRVVFAQAVLHEGDG